jgi:N-acylglucosamine 2-epimerase
MESDLIRRSVALYRETLLEDVMPFWMRHALGSADGAINNCLDDAGNRVSTDRYLWSQGRAMWTFAALYNRIERRPEWLEVARRLAGYLSAHGRDAQGRWVYRLDAAGNVLDADISLYVDGFVMNGLGEYYRATGEPRAARLAAETCENVLTRLRSPGSYGIAPYALPEGGKALGIPMIFSFFCHNLGMALDRPDIGRAGRELAEEILRDFYVPEMDVVLEIVRSEGGRIDAPEGRVCIPGHVIEAMWFLITIFEATGETERIPRCCDLIRRHLELGWDAEQGGLFLAVDVEGREPVAWKQPDCKPWWVPTEALVATAYAYRHTRQDWCLEWHRRIQEWAWNHYPVPSGEWTQWLDRHGQKTGTAALPVKDPFHLPRALIYLVDQLERD